jgi:ABC-type Fe3+-hydroxamate transport system substrate-binding protein
VQLTHSPTANEDDMSDDTTPKRPANPNRRATPSELRNTIKALTKAVAKEEKRAKVMSDLSKQIEELSGKLSSLRNPR